MTEHSWWLNIQTFRYIYEPVYNSYPVRKRPDF